MTTRCVAASALACALAIVSIPAKAQMPCGPVNDVTAAILKIGEKLAIDAQVKTAQGNVPIRIFAHPKTGTWTMMVIPAPGKACLVMVGEKWSPARLPGDDI